MTCPAWVLVASTLTNDGSAHLAPQEANPTKPTLSRVQALQVAIAAFLVLLADMGPLAALEPPPEPPPSKPRLVTTMARVSVEVIIATPTPAPRKVVSTSRTRGDTSIAGSGRCGGALPTCGVMMCESKGNLTAANRTSSARGKWQITSGTWNNYGGYSSADQAPEDVQDAKARELWAGGAGRGHWRQCL